MSQSNYSSRHPSFQYQAPSGNSRHASSKPKRHISRSVELAAFMVIASCLVIMKLSADAQAAILDSEHRIIMAENTAPIFSGPRIDAKRLNSEIDALISNHSELEVSVVYIDLTKNKTFNYGSSGTFTSASIGKLVTASMYLDQVDKGKRSLSDMVGGVTARSQLKAMIEISDNNAWLQLNTLLGYKELDAYGRSIGVANYDSYNNTLTAQGIATLLQKLQSGKLLSAESTDLLLGYLKAANYRQYIVAAVPDESTIYHKVGYLEDRVHDAAIIDNGKYPYVLVIFTKAKNGSYNFVRGGALIQNITKSVHKSYQ